ncbi:MAG: hypothetical protein SFW63_09240 [Alphaproteobacteria bacterium]|nr:hypothetical protein [Alphaproteobacteria bacterium]
MFDAFPLYVPLSLGAFIATLVGTRVLLVAQKRRTPAPEIAVLTRKKPPALPGGGGIAPVVAIMVCLTLADFPFEILLAMLLLAASCLMHSLISLPLMIRSLVMVLATTIPLSLMPHGLFGQWLPVNTDKLFTGLLWIWFMATTASIEKQDGPFTIPCIAIAGALCLVAVFAGQFPSPLSIHSLLVACALAGFMWWNWPPAKIRMGEVGAVPIAFLIGYLLMVAANSGYHYTAFILCAYIVSDGLATQLRRLATRHPSAPYFYQLAAAQGLAPRRIADLMIGVHLLLGFLALRCLIDPQSSLLYIALAYGCALALMVFFATRKPATESLPHA